MFQRSLNEIRLPNVKCDLMAVFVGEDDKSVPVNSQTMISPMRWRLMVIAKKTFPNDKEIQALQFSQIGESSP